MPRPTRRRPAALSRPRSTGAVAASLVVHTVLLAGLVRLVAAPVVLERLFRQPAASTAERVTFVSPPERRAGDGRVEGAAPPPEPVRRPSPAAPPRVPAPAVAPAVTPTGVTVATPAPVVPGAPGGLPGGTGRGQSGDGDGAGGLLPSFTDPRVWQRPVPDHGPPRSTAQRIDSMIVADFGPLADSAAADGARRKPGDWTFERNGKKYGMDRQYIRLGKFSLPTPILALLPLNQQANPVLLEENRRLGGMREESRAQALRRANDRDFNDVVKSIRARKERERAERRASAEPPPGS